MLVVARLLDGRKIKGHTTDFHPGHEVFHIVTAPGYGPIALPTQGLKAVFFVHDLEGNPERRDTREFPRTPGLARQKIWIEFKDGERMAGWPVSTPLGREGFYVIPTDPGSNVEKAYVFRSAVTKILQGSEAVLASRTEAERRRAGEREHTVIRVY